MSDEHPLVPDPPPASEIPHRRRGWPKMTPEHKRRMAEGRKRAKLARAAKMAKQVFAEPAPAKASPREGVGAGEFAGMTAVGIRITCPDACKGGHCYITGTDLCGHPRNGANQFANNPAVCERRKRAEKYLEHLSVEAR